MTPVHPESGSEHPAVVKLRERRAADVQLRVADAITRFAGSMSFAHDFRRMFATEAVNSGLPVHIVDDAQSGGFKSAVWHESGAA